MKIVLTRNVPAKSRAFTLVELLVVVGISIAVVLSVAPALAKQHPQSSVVRCMANMRTLMTAMSMYTQDNSEFMPPNPDDGNTLAGHNWCPGIAHAQGANGYDPDILKDRSRNLLAQYLSDDVSVYTCAADPRPSQPATGLSATNVLYQGRVLRPARSISMSGAVGTICPGFANGSGHWGKPVVPVNGPWLDNAHSHVSGRPYLTYPRLTLTAPSPEKLWVLIEEAPASVNDASFHVGMNVPEWIDFPGINHDYGAAISFADGHAELHRWVDPRTGHLLMGRVQVPGSKDYTWLAERTSAKAQ